MVCTGADRRGGTLAGVRIVLPDTPLEHGTIRLREWTDADVPAVAAACREPEIARWLDQVPQPYTERDARDYIASTRRGWRDGTISTFAIVDRASDEPLGSVSVHWLDAEQAVGEVGYWVTREARGRGVATAAVLLVSRWALEVCGLERLQLRADVLNAPSQRVAEKAGFRREGILRSARYSPRQGRRVDFVIYSLLPGELG
jgi:RimJ/RimL family protein N-acetyltransferase